MDALETVPIPGTGDARQPFFSPDGGSIGFFVHSSRAEGSQVAELKKIPVGGGLPVSLVQLSTSGSGGSSGGTWLEDDSIVFGSDVPLGGGRGLFRVSAAGGEPSAVAPYSGNGEEVLHRGPAAVPGGRGFVSIGWTGDSPWVYLHQPGSDGPVPLVRGGLARVSASGHLVFERDGALWAVASDNRSSVRAKHKR